MNFAVRDFLLYEDHIRHAFLKETQTVSRENEISMSGIKQESDDACYK